MANKPICLIPNCGKVSRTRGYCEGHYWRLRKHGDPLAGLTARGASMAALKTLFLIETDECILWDGPTVKGYPVVSRGKKLERAHRVVCEWNDGPCPPEKVDCAHSCHTPLCLNKRHLRWATRLENAQDRTAAERQTRGSAVKLSKLKEADIPIIRQLAAAGVTAVAIAEKFGVTDVAISCILTGKTWRHVR